MNMLAQRKQRFRKGLYEMLRLKDQKSVNSIAIHPGKKAVAFASDSSVAEYDL